MKKKLILAGAAMLLTAAAVTGFSAYNKTDASDLLNANIEALTSGESSTTCETFCYSNDAYRCSVYINGLLVARCMYMDKI